MRIVVRPHRILSHIVLIWHLRAGKWLEEGSHCGCHPSSPSLLLEFAAQSTGFLPRAGGEECAFAHPKKDWVGWVQENIYAVKSH